MNGMSPAADTRRKQSKRDEVSVSSMTLHAAFSLREFCESQGSWSLLYSRFLASP